MLKKTINRMALGVLLSGAFLGSSTQMNAMGNWGKALAVGCVMAVGYWMWNTAKSERMQKAVVNSAYWKTSLIVMKLNNFANSENELQALYRNDQDFKWLNEVTVHNYQCKNGKETIDVTFKGVTHRITRSIGDRACRIDRQ